MITLTSLLIMLPTSERKMCALRDKELSVFSSMIEAVKEVATRDNKPIDVPPSLYNVVMCNIGFNEEALMVILSHLLGNMAHGLGFVGMEVRHWTILL